MKTNIGKQLALLVATVVLLATASAAQNDGVVAWWKFNEGSGDFVVDSQTGKHDTILNHHQWTKGVSAGGLKFDGFTTVVERPAKEVPKLEAEFSLEAWVAIQTYPWNWVAIVDQEKDHHNGYYFGIDAQGRVGLQLSVWGTWETCVSQSRVPLMQWSYVVGTFDPQSGVRLYIDGKPAGECSVKGRSDPAKKTGLRIGRNFQDLPPTSLVRTSAAFPTYYSLDGILDELKIYNRALAAEEVAGTYQSTKPSTAPELTARHWPTLPKSNHFGAVYTALKLYPEWDALWRTGPYSDVVVSFADLPYHYVFWRGGNFGNTMVTENGIWVGDQSFESGTKVGTAEHMNDKHNMNSRISVVENTDARVVLHWQYGLVDVIGQFSNVDPATGWGDWADEFFYIYPDGVAVRYGTAYGTDEHYSFTEPHDPARTGEETRRLHFSAGSNSRKWQRRCANLFLGPGLSSVSFPGPSRRCQHCRSQLEIGVQTFLYLSGRHNPGSLWLAPPNYGPTIPIFRYGITGRSTRRRQMDVTSSSLMTLPVLRSCRLIPPAGLTGLARPRVVTFCLV